VQDFRWILLGLGAVLIAGIWWWGARRSFQLPGNAHLREKTVGTATSPVIKKSPASRGDILTDPEESRDWGVPPFEPLSIRTADFDDVPALDVPMSANETPLYALPASNSLETLAADAGPGLGGLSPAPTPTPAPALAPVSTAAPPPAPAATATATAVADEQRIVTVRVSAVGDSLWPGDALLEARASNDMVYGRYRVFHRNHADGRSLFCAASLVEPGTFDIARMPTEQFRGVTLFAVLPGPADALYTVHSLLATAQELSDALHGAVQDSTGAPLSAQRAEALREDVARSQNLS